MYAHDKARLDVVYNLSAPIHIRAFFVVYHALEGVHNVVFASVYDVESASRQHLTEIICND